MSNDSGRFFVVSVQRLSDTENWSVELCKPELLRNPLVHRCNVFIHVCALVLAWMMAVADNSEDASKSISSSGGGNTC